MYPSEEREDLAPSPQSRPLSPISNVSFSSLSPPYSTLRDEAEGSFPPRHQELRKMLDPHVLSRQGGAEVVLHGGVVVKSGHRVKHNEEAALLLVKRFTTIPVPEVYGSEYKLMGGRPWGQIWMEHLQGVPLSHRWNDLHWTTKEYLCREIWGFASQLRTISKPLEFVGLPLCGADGSAYDKSLLEDALSHPPIWGDYDPTRCRFTYEPQRPSPLVFTHGDLAPRNILVDENNVITGVLDWEFAGWYPEHCEYNMTQTQWARLDFDFWMRQTVPRRWCADGTPEDKNVLS